MCHVIMAVRIGHQLYILINTTITEIYPYFTLIYTNINAYSYPYIHSPYSNLPLHEDLDLLHIEPDIPAYSLQTILLEYRHKHGSGCVAVSVLFAQLHNTTVLPGVTEDVQYALPGAVHLRHIGFVFK